MTAVGFERHCAGIVAQTELLAALARSGDPDTPVRSCPGWDVRGLLRHVGGGHRWAEEIVRTRATQPVPDDQVRDLSGGPGDDPAGLGAWLADGAERLAGTLRAAGPDAAVWTPVSDGPHTAAFWARRFAHETLIHRADATLALGGTFTADEDLVLDALDEWMELGSLPQLLDVHPEKRELLGPGRTIHLHATDTPPESGAEWVVDLTGDAIRWRRAHEKSAVAVRGPLSELLLLVYRRRPPDGLDVFGDRELLGFWLQRVGFG